MSCEKRAYHSEPEASRAAHDFKRAVMRHYKCPHCDAYHLATASKGRPSERKSRSFLDTQRARRNR